MPTVGVVVPNRNDSRYLPRCLRSVLEQPPDELIVVDDQSTDDSVAVIRSHLQGAQFAQLIECPVNLGTMGALNKGLSRARSDYVLFLASNDFLVPGVFAHAKSCLARASYPGLWSAMVWLVDEEDRFIGLHPSSVVSLRDAYLSPQQCRRLAYRLGNWFTGTTVFFHRETLQELGGFDVSYKGLSDYLAALTVASRRGAAYSPAPLGTMRTHAGGYLASTLTDLDRLEAMLARLVERGPELEGPMFTPRFLSRLADRFRFAAFRASGADAMLHIARRYRGIRRMLLLGVARALPAVMRKTRLALAFVVLRPFDVLPMIWYRLLGSMIVRVRLRLTRES